MAHALFQWGSFVGAAGSPLAYKIECDALSAVSWKCIAEAALPSLRPFRSVVGIPEGGLLLAKALHKYRTPTSRLLLVVDDVWTTGCSMRAFAAQQLRKRSPVCNEWQGFVAFARGPMLPYVSCFAKIMVREPHVAHIIKTKRS